MNLEQWTTEKGEPLQKGFGTMRGWCEKFIGTPFLVDALELQKERVELEKRYDVLRRGRPAWRDRDLLSPVERAKEEESYRKKCEPLDKQRDDLSSRQDALEEKLLDHQIAEAKAEQSRMQRTLSKGEEEAEPSATEEEAAEEKKDAEKEAAHDGDDEGEEDEGLEKGDLSAWLLQKSGGPFIGPQGGKWADAAHTVPWHEDKPSSGGDSGGGRHEVTATSMERSRAKGGGTATRWSIQDKSKPGGQEYHHYDTHGATPGERRTAALKAHAEKHGITKQVVHVSGKPSFKGVEQNALGDGNKTIKVPTGKGVAEVHATHTAGDFAVHQTPNASKGYTVTHVPTGLALHKHDSSTAARAHADHMHEKMGVGALSGAKFGKAPGKEHGPALAKMKAAHGEFLTKHGKDKTELQKSGDGGSMDLQDWLVKADSVPAVETDKLSPEDRDPEDQMSFGKTALEKAPTDPGAPAAASVPTGIGAPAPGTDKLSPEDREPEQQMSPGETAIERAAKSLDGGGPRDDVRERIAQARRLEKGLDITLGRSAPRVPTSGASDLAAETLMKARDVFQGGVPSLSPMTAILNRAVLCKSCGNHQPAALSACPSCGAGGTSVQMGPGGSMSSGSMQVVSDRPGMSLRPAPRPRDFVVR